jgi:hypothetical protein
MNPRIVDSGLSEFRVYLCRETIKQDIASGKKIVYYNEEKVEKEEGRNMAKKANPGPKRSKSKRK